MHLTFVVVGEVLVGEAVVVYVGRDSKLLVSTWESFQDCEPAGWIFLPHFPAVSHSSFDLLAATELDVSEGGGGLFFSLARCPDCWQDYESLHFAFRSWQVVGISNVVGRFQ